MAKRRQTAHAAGAKTRRILEALHGPALSQTESKRATDYLSAKFRREVEQRNRRQDEARKLIKPLLDAVAREHAEEAKGVRQKSEAFARRTTPIRLSNTPKFEPALMQGSIVAVFAPPYDFGTQHIQGKQQASGNKNTGEIHVRCQSIGGPPGAADAQIGKWFHPIANGIVRFRTAVHFSFSWDDSSVLQTAHNRGFIGVYIWENTNGVSRLIIDNRMQLWNDGTAWYEHHHDAGDDRHEFFDIPFFANTRSAYFLGVWCGCSLDADSGLFSFSSATGELTGRVPLIVVKS